MARPKLAIGIRVRTGRCTVVTLGAPASSPEFVDRRELSTWDRHVPESQAPYHAGLERKGAEAQRVVERATLAVRRATEAALESFVSQLKGGVDIVAIGLVVASLTDPETIRQPHMRAHAAEGRLFHQALVNAADALDIAHTSWLEKQLTAHAITSLKKSETQLKAALAAFGKQAGSPWRAQEKSACVAAWLGLRPTTRKTTPL